MSEYESATTGAALFDTSAAAKLELTGPDVPMFLANLCTNDIKNLPAGRGCAAYFCDPRGKVQFQTWIYNASPSFWIETTAGRNEALFKYLDRYRISERVELTDRTMEFAQFHLAGPMARTVLEKALGDAFDLPEFGHVDGKIRRRDWIGIAGFDLLAARDEAAGLRKRVLDAGAREAGANVFETLRIEAGTPLFGPDIDDNRFVMEVGGADRAVSFTKGCYLGQEPIVMARDRAGHVNRLFVGLKALEGELPPPPGTRLTHEGQDVGQVTSSCQSPWLGAPLALAYVRWKHHEPGTRLVGESQTVEVIPNSAFRIPD
ncbi:MAG TPA: glycine cleavage T C-terminal barrel domain-containing protein [Urbifossiella sp.]|nr:glycine cleavage T C-terminal barrel domain-containing protein [Urbifossiella sp.]